MFFIILQRYKYFILFQNFFSPAVKDVQLLSGFFCEVEVLSPAVKDVQLLSGFSRVIE
jgi:hypothetical protein